MKTRRILLATFIATVVAAVGVAAWLMFRAPSTPDRPIGLTLLVNLRSRIDITPGTPLVFELSLGSSPSSASLDVGSRSRPWHELMRLESGDSENAIPWPLARVGAPRSMHVVRESNGRPSVTEETSAIARLDAGEHVHTVTFASGPEETASIKPGTYRIRGVLETPFWLVWGWRGRAVSPAATVVVIDASQAGEKGQQLEAERLARAADFYLNVGRFSDAHTLASSLAERKPQEARSFIILGDALAALDRRQEALDAYRRAMTLIPPSYEEPTLLMDRIARVVAARKSETGQ